MLGHVSDEASQAGELTTASTKGDLYDLEQDLLELDNLWEEPPAAALRARLTQQSFDATAAPCDPTPTGLGASEPGMDYPITPVTFTEVTGGEPQALHRVVQRS